MAKLGDIPPIIERWTLPRWLWRDYFFRYRWWIMGAGILMAIEGSMVGVISYMVRPMFDQVFVAGSHAAVFWIATIILVVFLARACAGFGQRVIMAAIAQWVTTTMQSDLVRHMMKLDSGFFQDNAPGALIERVRGDTVVIQTAFTLVFTALGRDIISVVALIAVALSIDWTWTLVAIMGVPVLIVPVAILQRLIQVSTRSARAAAADISTRLDEIFHGINPIKLNTLESQQDRRFLATVRKFVKVQIRSEAGQAGVPAMMDLIAGIGFFGVLLYGGFQIIDGNKSLGEFMSFFTAMGLVFEPLRRIGNISARWQAARGSLERLYTIFRQEPHILDPARPVMLPNDAGRGDIVLRDVDFSYGDQPVLSGLDLVAEAGK
ncbi:MAG: ABC transporter transmembrane domain-containing protein, partial [Paracoccaceae bacterium]